MEKQKPRFSQGFKVSLFFAIGMGILLILILVGQAQQYPEQKTITSAGKQVKVEYLDKAARDVKYELTRGLGMIKDYFSFDSYITDVDHNGVLDYVVRYKDVDYTSIDSMSLILGAYLPAEDVLFMLACRAVAIVSNRTHWKSDKLYVGYPGYSKVLVVTTRSTRECYIQTYHNDAAFLSCVESVMWAEHRKLPKK